MDNWISVEDRLPEMEKRVLIVSETHNTVLEALRYEGSKFNRFGCDVTAKFWQPLPEPRKESQSVINKRKSK